MSVWTQSVEQVVNAALAHVGFPRRIGDMLEGSEEAKLALDVYGQTRDETLRLEDWDFAQRTASLTLIKSAPAVPGGHGYVVPWNPAIHPPLPWLFEYAYPSDCVKVRAVKPTPIFVPSFDPQPHAFTVSNDQAQAPPARVILSNVPSAVAIYTGQVVDMTTWDPAFAEALIAALGKRLAPALARLSQSAPEADKVEAAGEAAAEAAGEREAT